jgi:hypothetical protein
LIEKPFAPAQVLTAVAAVERWKHPWRISVGGDCSLGNRERRKGMLPERTRRSRMAITRAVYDPPISSLRYLVAVFHPDGPVPKTAGRST